MFLAVVVGFNLLVDVSSELIAFSAGNTRNQTVTYGHKILFDHIFLNDGDGYKQASGVFQAPKAGSYIFYVNILSDWKTLGYVAIVKNEKTIAYVYAKQTTRYDSAGNNVILRLRQNDLVYLKVLNDAQLYGLKHEVYSTFCGYLLQ